MKKIKVYSEINNKAILKKFLYKGEYISKGADFAILQTKDGEYKIKAPFSGRVKKPSKLNRKIRRKTALAYIIPDIIPTKHKPIKEKNHNKKYNNSLNINFNGWRSLEQNEYLEEIDDKNVPEPTPKTLSRENQKLMFDLNKSKNLINKLKEENEEKETLLEHNKRLMEENQQKLLNKKSKNKQQQKVNETFANLSASFKERKASISKDAISVDEKTHNSIDFLDENGRPKILRNIISNRMNKLIEQNLSNDNIAYENTPKAKNYKSTIYNQESKKELNGNSIYSNGYSFTGGSNPFEEINKEKEFLHQQNVKNDIYRKRYKPISQYDVKKPKEILANNQIQYLQNSNNPYDRIKLRMLKMQSGDSINENDREIPLSRNNNNNSTVNNWLENQYLSHPDNKNNQNPNLRQQAKFNFSNVANNHFLKENSNNTFTNPHKTYDSFNQNYIQSSYNDNKQNNFDKNIIKKEIIREQVPFYINNQPQPNFLNNQNPNSEQLLKQQSNYYELSNEIKNLNLKLDMQSNYQNQNNLIDKLHNLELKIANINNKPNNNGANAIDNNTISINSMNNLNNELIRTLQLLLNKPDSNKDLLKDISTLIIQNANKANQNNSQPSVQPYIVQNLINKVNEKHFDPNINTVNQKAKYETKPASPFEEINNIPSVPIDLVKENIKEEIPITINAELNKENTINDSEVRNDHYNNNIHSNYENNDLKSEEFNNNSKEKDELVINLDEIEKPLEVNEKSIASAKDTLSQDETSNDIQSIYKKSNEKINSKIQEILEEINFSDRENITKISSEPFDRAKVEEKEITVDDSIESQAKEIIEENNAENDIQSIYKSASEIVDENTKDIDADNNTKLDKSKNLIIKQPIIKEKELDSNDINLDEIKDNLQNNESPNDIQSIYQNAKKITDESDNDLTLEKLLSRLKSDLNKIEEPLKPIVDDFKNPNNLDNNLKNMLSRLKSDLENIEKIYEKSNDNNINSSPYVIENMHNIKKEEVLDIEEEIEPFDRAKVEEKEITVDDSIESQAKEIIEENNAENDIQSIYQNADKITNSNVVKNITDDNEIDLSKLENVTYKQPIIKEKELDSNDINLDEIKDTLQNNNNSPNDIQSIYQNANKKLNKNSYLQNNIDSQNNVDYQVANNNEVFYPTADNNTKNLNYKNKIHIQNLNVYNNPNYNPSQFIDFFDNKKTNNKLEKKLNTDKNININQADNNVNKKENIDDLVISNSKKQLENILNNQDATLYDFSETEYDNVKNTLLTENKKPNPLEVVQQNNYVSSKKQLENVLNKDYDNLIDLSNDNYVNLKKELLETNTALKNDFVILQNNKVALNNNIKETNKAFENNDLSKSELFIKKQNNLLKNSKPTAKLTLKNEVKNRSIIQDGKMLLQYDDDAIISEIESIEAEAKRFNNQRLFPTPLIRETNISIENNDKYNNINYSKIKTKAINFTVDVTMLLKLQYRFKKANKALGINFSIKSFIVKAISETLLKNSNLNLIKDLKKDIALQKFSHNVGLALDIDQGVIIPVIRYVDRLQIRQISSCEQDLEYRLANGELFDYEVYGYSIVLSRFEHVISGIKFDILSKIGTIIAVDKIEKQVVRINNTENQIRYLLNFAVVFNAKHISKHMASKFANLLKKIIENPSDLVN